LHFYVLLLLLVTLATNVLAFRLAGIVAMTARQLKPIEKLSM
jgi:hypothetical protein